nr:ABC transporter substrate-binding protein [Corynebacterium sp. MSK156]MDK8787316.1 ABC transporter substrate-binding protein [Corynebacterium sp. MSK156]
MGRLFLVYKESTMKKIHRALLSVVAVASLALTACSTAEEEDQGSNKGTSESALQIEDNNGTHELDVPFERVAVTDNRAFEILADWDVNIVAAPLGIVPDTLSDKINEDTIEANLGMHREPDLEALVAAEPDIVINGQRFTQHQADIEALMEDTPVLDFSPRDDKDMAEELIRQTEALGKIFDHEDEAKKLVDDFKKALDRAKDAYDSEKTVMAVNTSGGDINYIAPGKGRFFGPFFDLLGMKPSLEVENASDDHEGDDISVEAIADSNPDYILIMDRDGAVAKDEAGYTPGKKLVEDSAALKNVTAVKEGKIVSAPQDTYTNENIITFTETLNAMADAFEKN